MEAMAYLPVNACPVRKRKRVNSASREDFWSAFALATAFRPWHSRPSGLSRTSVYACEVRSKVCQCSLQVEMAALRDIVRTASMDATSKKFVRGTADA
jgi:hypothetical protein